MFQRVQEALRANQRRTQGHPKRDYLLRGFLRCKHCGKSISGLYSRKSYRRKDGSLWTGGSRHYVCNGYQNYQDTALPHRCVLRYINADALEEAGCTCDDILSHCRKPADHVRGCWVVDLIMGKK